MPPLTHPDSIHSWWSDRNSVGPTISLHAIAKPLIKVMYHQQAMGFIKRNRGLPLSGMTLLIFSSYLMYVLFGFDRILRLTVCRYKYLSSATKSAILMELAARAESEDDAHAVVDSLVFHQIAELLESPCAEIRRSTCWMLGKLASHESTEAPVLHLKPCSKLVFLLR
jgi:hypothetical protein